MTLEHVPSPSGETHSSGKPAGLALIAGSVVMLVFLAMHPSIHGHGGASRVAEVAAIAGRNALVHGALIANQGLILLGLLGLTDRLGLRLHTVRAGMIAFAFGTLGFIGAPLINGFVVPGVILHKEITEATATGVNAALGLAHEASMVLVYMGIPAISAAVVAWSAVLLRRGGPGIALGGLGMVCGAVPFLGIVTGYMPLDLHGLMVFALLQAAWYVAIGVQLIRDRI